MVNRCTGWFYCYQREQITPCSFVSSKIAIFFPTKIELVLLYSVLKRRKVKIEKNVTNVNLNANWDQAYNVFLFSPLYNNFFYQEYGM